MNISLASFQASLLHKVVAAGASVISDWEIEKGHLVTALILAVLGVIAVPLRRTLSNNGTWRPDPVLARWFKRITLTGVGCVFLFSSIYMVWGKVVTLDVSSAAGESRRSMIALVTDNGSDKLGTAEIFSTDDQGVLQTWKLPGRHHYLMIRPEKEALIYSMAIREKSFFPLEVKFNPPFHRVSLVQSILDRFVFDRDVLPGNGGPLSEALREAIKNSEQWYLVTGHTDKVGDGGYNKDLGKRRAKAAADYLESLGVPRHHIIIGSCGADFPANRAGSVSTHYGKGEPLDRRVEVLCIPNPYVIPIDDGLEDFKQ